MFCLIFFIYSFTTIAFSQEECSDENEIKLVLVPEHREYTDYGDHFVAEYYKHVIIKSNIICSNVQLPMTYQPFDKNYENATTYLIITSLNTTIIPPLSFQNVVKFDFLVLNNLGIEKLMPSAFSSKSLKKIFLSNNNLTEIGLGIFNHLIELELLDLSNNNIKTIHEHSFLGLINLTSLILSNNQLKNLPFTVLDPNIISMDLLDVSNNILENISLKNDFIIKEFKVSNNNLKTIDFCPVIFTKLYLNNNSIYTLPLNKCIDQTNRLKVLDVSYNKISNLDGLIIENSILTQLDISNNNISSISTDFFYNMVFLEYLNISHNSIEYFQHGIFDHISGLKTLDVSFNILTKVDSFYSLSNLINLYINNNNINYINPLDFFRDIPKLEFLSVDDNKLTCSNLIDIMRYLKNTPIDLYYGHTKNSSNIHGIACDENDVFDSKPNFEHFLSTMLKDMSRQSKNNVDVLKDYFEGEFKNSSFYKFMENLQNSDHVRLDDTGMYKYFNNNFNQSKFYEYLESLKDTEYSINFAKNVTDFIDAIKNNKFDKYLKNYKIKGDDEVFDKQMFNYFNTDFEKSEFFKYLENLRIVSNKHTPNYDNFNTGYTKLFVSNMFTLFFMIVICCLLGILVYEFVFVVKSRKSETVELVNDEI